MRNPFSAPTIAELFLRPTAPQDGRFDEFFPYIQLRNGTFKTTTSMRHIDVDQALSNVLSQGREYRILDLAVSSGTGTVELTNQLTKAGIQHTMIGTDLSIRAECRRVPPVTILCDADGFLYQVDVVGLAFPNTPPSKLSSLVFRLARAARLLHRTVIRQPKKIFLLSRIASESNIQFETGDIFGTVVSGLAEARFDVIRASNILNRSYFSAEQITLAIRNLRKHLNDEGFLVINRTDNSTNHFSIFQLHGSQFTIVYDGNDGSEISDLVVGLGIA